MKSQELLEILKENVLNVFSPLDVYRITRKTKHYVNLLLYRMTKKGLIMRIERDKYALKIALYIIASNIIRPSYVSSMFAFSYYGLTTQLPAKIDVICTKQHKTLDLEGIKIRFIKTDKTRVFAFLKDSNNAFVAEPEKAVIDSLYFNTLSFGSISEAVSIGLNKNVLNVNKLNDYALRMKNTALMNKLGFLLADNGIDDKNIYPDISKNYVKLSKSGAKIDKRWKIIYG